MAYPTDKPSGNYVLRDYNFATLDDKKIPMDEYTFKNGYKNADESEVESVPDAHEQNWLFDVLHRNLKYTKEVAEENKTLLSSKVATYTSIGQIKAGYGLEIKADGTLGVIKGIAESADIISYDLPVGSYMFWAGIQPPEYFIIPQGQTLLRTQYPELWEFAQSNDLIGKLFGEGDGSTTFEVYDVQEELIHDLKIILKAMPTPPSNAVPTGTILDYTGSVAPDGYIIANGAALSRITYSTLFNWANKNGLIKTQSSLPSTAHGYYGDGDGSTTFTIPDLRGVFKRNANLSSGRGGVDLGVYQADGLPNITGSFAPSEGDNGGIVRFGASSNKITSGALFLGSTTTAKVATETNNTWFAGVLSFDASRSSSIYGSSSTVQPKSVSLTPILKY
jgi:hypothetical protein